MTRIRETPRHVHRRRIEYHAVSIHTVSHLYTRHTNTCLHAYTYVRFTLYTWHTLLARCIRTRFTEWSINLKLRLVGVPPFLHRIFDFRFFFFCRRSCGENGGDRSNCGGNDDRNVAVGSLTIVWSLLERRLIRATRLSDYSRLILLNSLRFVGYCITFIPDDADEDIHIIYFKRNLL